MLDQMETAWQIIDHFKKVHWGEVYENFKFPVLPKITDEEIRWLNKKLKPNKAISWDCVSTEILWVHDKCFTGERPKCKECQKKTKIWEGLLNI